MRGHSPAQYRIYGFCFSRPACPPPTAPLFPKGRGGKSLILGMGKGMASEISSSMDAALRRFNIFRRSVSETPNMAIREREGRLLIFQPPCGLLNACCFEICAFSLCVLCPALWKAPSGSVSRAAFPPAAEGRPSPPENGQTKAGFFEETAKRFFHKQQTPPLQPLKTGQAL